jgi:tetratricopeptide (TPR) repeat protein
MRAFVATAALVLLVFGAIRTAQAGEEPEGQGVPSVPVTIVLRNGQTEEAMLVKGSPDGALTLRTEYGERTLARSDWMEVRPKTSPREFTVAEGLLRSGRYAAAAAKYQEIYDTYAGLYVFGDEALDGKGQALMSQDKWPEALKAYEQLFREYSGNDLTYARRQRYAHCLAEAGGEPGREKAVALLEQIIATTDDVRTVRALDLLGHIHYAGGKHYLALRSYLQVLILYRNYEGDGAAEVQRLGQQARENAIGCCDKLIKSSNESMKKRAEKVKARLSGEES